MTKTLTEQWRDGKLSDGWYYCHFYDGVKKLYCGDGESLELDDPETSAYYFFHKKLDKGQVEVLSAVPSYDEWQAELDSNNELLNVQKRLENKIKLLEEQLNNALETMGQVAKLSDNTVDAVQCAHAICLINERLKEMEGVK